MVDDVKDNTKITISKGWIKLGYMKKPKYTSWQFHFEDWHLKTRDIYFVFIDKITKSKYYAIIWNKYVFCRRLDCE